jgi:hypothetical protein
MQDDVLALGDSALEVDALTGILLRHPRKIGDESFLAISYGRVVLNVYIPDVPFNSFGRLTLVEHESIESHCVGFVLLKLTCHETSNYVNQTLEGIREYHIWPVLARNALSTEMPGHKGQGH